MTFRRRLTLGALASTGLAAAAVKIERSPSTFDPTTPLGNAASGVIAAVRFARAFGTAGTIMADYRYLFYTHTDYNSDQYKSARSEVHKRSAAKLLHLARTQGAVYVKIGQHIASMNHAVPDEYSSQLKLLEDRAAYRPYPQIKRMVESQLHSPLNDLFLEFDETPVAAASLAQVHAARLRETGEKVAVKVQYPGLESLVHGDLISIRFLSRLLSWVFPFFDMHWVVDQFRRNLEQELNFLLEANSAVRTSHFFENDERIFVPQMHFKYSTSRVLTMEYIDGCRVDDIKALQAAGIDMHKLAQAVVEAFAQMIFVNGFVHCDPHAGNLMVRAKENGQYELFLLDHGLYRELDDDFRQSYCKLWKGLVLRNERDVAEASEELGAPGFANVFSIFLLNRSWTFAKQLRTDIKQKMSKEEMRRLRKDLSAGGIKSQADVSAFVEKVPDDLLLVFKMNSLVRNVNRALGASVNRFKVNARYAVRGLWHLNGTAQSTDASQVAILASTHKEMVVEGILGYLRSIAFKLAQYADSVSVEVNLFALDVALFVMRWWMSGNLWSMLTNVIEEDSSERKLIG